MRTLTGSFHAYIVPAITSVGSAVPARTVTNKDLEATLATTDDWIRQRTGIERRHLASTEDKTGALAANAAQAALNASWLTAEELDAIIVATSTPDDAIVPTACQVQAALGASQAFAFDLAAACSGFVYACAIAGQWIKSGQVQHALVIGSEIFSRLVNWSDRQTAILFGDGAGAVVLNAVPSSRDDWYCHLGADGSGKDRSRVALVGFGAGLTWATCLLTYQPLAVEQTSGGGNEAIYALTRESENTRR